ncbi:hypothetical protein [Deinococcus soli (ex Cha et al. 2016)]|uniref:Uncharacterized protein n=2 Tax=Deinococcus soli (ex Cha et al. 2016) TaxID=1309411 RepID=A0ACC6KH51_9DEIO|nr:hypothetical protein [Deinococcus soli (ex Cha et al. 2016)]MDR6218822.1 hypothetical protein [Deinococcus soli (ex Cha et al. 2016)]MDR6328619.1 hypothetical protein [Deinococcus soli (ex Cha et al. 2016)]MDR6751894.1 hypothetical protein [Deinococcus soli (ex Cha et al. 2016)]
MTPPSPFILTSVDGTRHMEVESDWTFVSVAEALSVFTFADVQSVREEVGDDVLVHTGNGAAPERVDLAAFSAELLAQHEREVAGRRGVQSISDSHGQVQDAFYDAAMSLTPVLSAPLLEALRGAGLDPDVPVVLADVTFDLRGAHLALRPVLAFGELGAPYHVPVDHVALGAFDVTANQSRIRVRSWLSEMALGKPNILAAGASANGGPGELAVLPDGMLRYLGPDPLGFKNTAQRFLAFSPEQLALLTSFARGFDVTPGFAG